MLSPEFCLVKAGYNTGTIYKHLFHTLIIVMLLPPSILHSLAANNAYGYERPEDELWRIAETDRDNIFSAIRDLKNTTKKWLSAYSSLFDDEGSELLTELLLNLIMDLPDNIAQLNGVRLNRIRESLNARSRLQQENSGPRDFVLVERTDGVQTQPLSIQWSTTHLPSTFDPPPSSGISDIASEVVEPSSSEASNHNTSLPYQSAPKAEQRSELVPLENIAGALPYPGFAVRQGHWRSLHRPFELAVEPSATISDDEGSFEVSFVPDDSDLLPMSFEVTGNGVEERGREEVLRQHLMLSRNAGFFRERTIHEIDEDLFPSVLMDIKEEEEKLKDIKAFASRTARHLWDSPAESALSPDFVFGENAPAAFTVSSASNGQRSCSPLPTFSPDSTKKRKREEDDEFSSDSSVSRPRKQKSGFIGLVSATLGKLLSG
ncbi:hypothetical protein DL96DRAFT_1040051 [Flagelloscypha sp. PMI_526]|nr:hypothetical protein DL96DRAFT_1040051 [Flagelloscypha sp. PMI_526]